MNRKEHQVRQVFFFALFAALAVSLFSHLLFRRRSGIYAISDIDRLIYPGAYPDGTAIGFESFAIYQESAITTPKS